MIKKVFIALMVLSFTVISFASNEGSESQKQSKPNLCGTWKLDKSEGNYAKYAGLEPEADLILVISHSEPEIKVSRKLTRKGEDVIQDLTYYSNGRGEVSYTFIDNHKAKSKTKWKDNKLVSKFAVTIDSGKGIIIDVTQEWELSTDGKILIQTQKSKLREDTALLESLGIRNPPLHDIVRVFNRIS